MRHTPSQRSDRSIGMEFSEEIMRELQAEKEDVDRIRKERHRVHELKEDFARRQSEIQRITYENRQLQKYKSYYDKYEKLKEMLDDAVGKVHFEIIKCQVKDRDNNKLLVELDRALLQIESLQKRVTDADKSRTSLIKQRTHLERINKEIQETFYQYKRECKQKQKDLMQRLDKAHRQTKQDRKLIEQLEQIRMQLTIHQKRISELEQVNRQHQQHSNHLIEMLRIKEQEIAAARMDFSKKLEQVPVTTIGNQSQLIQENQQLKRDLFDREKQLQKSKALNHELSIEFDRSVTRIGQLQRQLSQYRRENHQLKKTLTLFIQKDEYDKMHRQHMLDDSDIESQRMSEQEATYQQRGDSYA